MIREMELFEKELQMDLDDREKEIKELNEQL